MDRDLWDWTYDQGFSFSDAGESSNNVESGWQADFGKDVIEEDAMNEKYCVQVLKILIRKAADEIDDLQEDLVLLRCNLAWTESRDQFEACCNALREKIDVLHNSIKSLRRSEKINAADKLPLHRQPAEKLYEILKPFLGEGREQDDMQDQHATVNIQSTDTSMQLVGPFCETSSILGMKVKSEEMEVKSILLAVDSIPAQMHQENDSIGDKKVKPEIAVEGVCSPVSVQNVCLKLDDLKSISKVEIEEAVEHCINNSCKSRKLKSDSNVVGEPGLPKTPKHGKTVFEKASPDVTRQSVGFCGNKRSFDTNSSSPAYSKSGKCYIEEEKLIDFLLRKKNKSGAGPILPESKVDYDLSVSTTRKPGTFDTSNSHIMLLSKLQDQQANHLVRNQTKEAHKLLLDNSRSVENVCHEKSHSNAGQKPKAFPEKGKSKSNTSISKEKKHRKPGAIGDNACLDLPLEQKSRMKSVEMQDGDISSSSHKKGTLKMPVGRDFIDLSFDDDISSSDEIEPDNRAREDKQIVKDNHIDEVLRLFSSNKDLKMMNVAQLRILAKEYNLTKYHKLRKEELVNMLVQNIENIYFNQPS